MKDLKYQLVLLSINIRSRLGSVLVVTAQRTSLMSYIYDGSTVLNIFGKGKLVPFPKAPIITLLGPSRISLLDSNNSGKSLKLPCVRH